MEQLGQPAPASASSMIRLMVRAHRPHWALQPRQPYTWLAVRGASGAATALRTSRSLKTLQEQTIMGMRRRRGLLPILIWLLLAEVLI